MPRTAVDAEMSPVSVNPSSAASAALAARPMPVSSIPPHHTGTPELDAQVVDPPRLEVAADPARLDVDDLAGPELDRVARDRHRGDRLVEADRCRRRLGEAGVADEVVLGQRLLDQQQVELVEAAQVVDVVAAVRGVGVDLERDVRARSGRRTAATGSRSQPGSIFSLMRT